MNEGTGPDPELGSLALSLQDQATVRSSISQNPGVGHEGLQYMGRKGERTCFKYDCRLVFECVHMLVMR